MNKQLSHALFQWPKPYISGSDLHFILGESADSRQAIVKRAMQEKMLIHLRRDLFLINTELAYDPFEIAAIMYGPSYISFESALSLHSWIPERVASITSATIKRKKEFQTPIGVFSFEHIPVSSFEVGIGSTSPFIATPLKALADMIYARMKSWSNLNDLYEDLRIDPEHLLSCDKRLLQELIESYPSLRVKKVLKNLENF